MIGIPAVLVAAARPLRAAALCLLLLLPGFVHPGPELEGSVEVVSAFRGMDTRASVARSALSLSGVGRARVTIENASVPPRERSSRPIVLDGGGGSLWVRVLDTEGHPVREAVVQVLLDGKPIGGDLTNPAGTVEVRGQREEQGELTVRVVPPSENPNLLPARFTLATGGDLLTVRLEHSARIEGHLAEQSSGTNLALAEIRYWIDEADAAWGIAKADAQGRFVIGGVRPGSTVKFSLHNPKASVAPATIRLNADAQLDVEHVELRADVQGLCTVRIDGWSKDLRPYARLSPIRAGVQWPDVEAGVSHDGVAVFWQVPDADSFLIYVESQNKVGAPGFVAFVASAPTGEHRVRGLPLERISGEILLPVDMVLAELGIRVAGQSRRVPVDADGRFQQDAPVGIPIQFSGVATGVDGKRVRRSIRAMHGAPNILDFR